MSSSSSKSAAAGRSTPSPPEELIKVVVVISLKSFQLSLSLSLSPSYIFSFVSFSCVVEKKPKQIIQNGYSSSAIEDTYFNLMDYETFTGLPRNDASGSEPAYLSASDLSAQYLETLVTPAIPGIAIASLLFIVCFLVVFLRVCTKCCAMCCPGSCWDEKCFRPKEYTSRQLKITKWAMLVFCIIGGIGCVLVFSQGTEVSKGVTDFGDELVNTTKSLEVIINDWYAALVQASQEGSEDLADLQSSSVDISSSVVDLNDQIKGVAEKIELSFMVVAAIVFIVAIIATGLVCLGWSTMLMLFFFTLSLVMIVCWIVFGALGTIGTLIDDIALGFDAFAMDANIQNAFPTGSSLCPSRYNSASSVNEDLRSTYYDIINEIQSEAQNTAICPNCAQVSQIYDRVTVDYYCNWYNTRNVILPPRKLLAGRHAAKTRSPLMLTMNSSRSSTTSGTFWPLKIPSANSSRATLFNRKPRKSPRPYTPSLMRSKFSGVASSCSACLISSCG